MNSGGLSLISMTCMVMASVTTSKGNNWGHVRSDTQFAHILSWKLLEMRSLPHSALADWHLTGLAHYKGAEVSKAEQLFKQRRHKLGIRPDSGLCKSIVFGFCLAKTNFLWAQYHLHISSEADMTISNVGFISWSTMSDTVISPFESSIWKGMACETMP